MGYLRYIFVIQIALFALLGGAKSEAQTQITVASNAEKNTLSIAPPNQDFSDNNWDKNPFELHYADGRNFNSDSLKGKAVFVDAWATWCAPCMPSLPKFTKLYENSLSNPYVKVLSVHYGERYGRFNSAAEFLQNKGLTYPVLQDTDGRFVKRLDSVSSNFSVPHYVLMDGTGKVVRRYGEINDMVILDVQNYFLSHSKAARLDAVSLP